MVKIDTSVRGWKKILKYDKSALIKGGLSVVVLILLLVLQDYTMFVLTLGVSAFMVSAELFNTCIELICDYLTSDYDERIKIIKDVAAASTNIAYFLWLEVLAWKVYQLIVTYTL